MKATSFREILELKMSSRASFSSHSSASPSSSSEIQVAPFKSRPTLEELLSQIHRITEEKSPHTPTFDSRLGRENSPKGHGPKSRFFKIHGSKDRARITLWKTVEEKNAILTFQSLGAPVDFTTPLEEIRTAYKRLVFEFHPDRHQLETPKKLGWLTFKLQKLMGAFAVLSNSTDNATAA